MKKGQLSKDTFHYRETHRFNDSNFILAVRDRDSNTNIYSILYYQDGKVFDIDDYEMGEKIWTTPNNYMLDVPPITSRFLLNQLIKISTGYIIENPGHFENETRPKCKTFHTNLHEIDENEILEIFEGSIDENQSLFKLYNFELSELIRELYISSGKQFYILDNGKIIGPFKVVKVDKDENFIIEKGSFKRFGIYEFIDKSYIEFIANDIIRRIIIPNAIEPRFLEESEFMSDSQLVLKFEEQIKTNQNDFEMSHLRSLMEFAQRIQTFPLYGFDGKYQDRLKTILKTSENQLLNNIEIASLLPEIGQIKVEIDDLEKKRLALKNELDEINGRVSKVTNQRDLLLDELDNLTKRKEEELRGKKLYLEAEINELELRRNAIDEEIEKEKKEKSTEISKIEGSIRYLEEKKTSLELGIKTLQDEFTSEQKTAHEKLKELLQQNQHFNILSGREFANSAISPESVFSDYRHLVNKFAEFGGKLEKYEHLRNTVSGIFEKNNRKLESHFIDNILISISQNLLTLFAGLPGTGKTSLVRILTHILSPKERIREVSIGRGWTSQKDLIGFFNPLSNSFNSASTNFHSLLKQLDFESKKNWHLDSPLSFVILDEANLSPMEHYWSLFYNLTDSACRSGNLLKINLGGNEIIEYANNLRFIGTINYDQTTEELSPRIIDRVNIIRMNPKNFDINGVSNSDVEDIEIRFKDVIELFDLSDFGNEEKIFDFDIASEKRFTEIRKKLEELKVFISPRVQISIKRYCAIARKLMYEENKPLDYCIAQRILPMIRVQGKGARTKLMELLDIFKANRYDISAKLLDDILLAGSEGEMFQDNYNYFLTLSYV